MTTTIKPFDANDVVYNYNYLQANAPTTATSSSPSAADYTSCQTGFQAAITKYLITDPKE